MEGLEALEGWDREQVRAALQDAIAAREPDNSEGHCLCPPEPGLHCLQLGRWHDPHTPLPFPVNATTTRTSSQGAGQRAFCIPGGTALSIDKAGQASRHSPKNSRGELPRRFKSVLGSTLCRFPALRVF